MGCVVSVEGQALGLGFVRSTADAHHGCQDFSGGMSKCTGHEKWAGAGFLLPFTPSARSDLWDYLWCGCRIISEKVQAGL